MTVTAAELGELTAAGVPLGALTALHVSRNPHRNGWYLPVHLRADCDRDSLPLTDPGTLADRLGEEPAGAAMFTCGDCMPHPPQNEEVDDALTALGQLAAALRRTDQRLDQVAGHLAEPAECTRRLTGEPLATLRADLDPRVRPDGTAFVLLAGTALPPQTLAWLTAWQATRADQLTRLLGEYTGATDRQQSAGGDRYVAVLEPSTSLTDVTLPAGARDILLTHDPVGWLGPWGLYRLPGGPATALVAVRRPFEDHLEFSRDLGEAVDGDDDGELLTVAAALFDGRDARAPLADPTAALATARALLTTGAVT